MDALYNQHGQVAAWLDRVAGQILDLSGQHKAFIDDDSVYDYSGRHIGWWQDDHIRDGAGAVALFGQNAKNLGVYKPYLGYAPYQPYKAYVPYRPYKAFKPYRPYSQAAWSSRSIFA